MAGLMSSVGLSKSLSLGPGVTNTCVKLILESQGFHNFEILESSQRVGGYETQLSYLW